MPAPLVGAAAAVAARLVAKKLAQQGAKKVAKTAATRARSNSASAAKIVAPKASIAKRQQMIAAQGKLSPKEIVKTNPQFQGKIKSVLPSRVLGGRSVKVVNPSSATNRAASNAANKPPSKADAKWSMENAKLSARKGGKVKINTDPTKTGIFTPLKKKLASANTPENRAKAAAAARALKAANKNR